MSKGIMGTPSRARHVVPFEKATKIGSCHDGSVWVEISWDGKRLSLMGVVGPRSDGNAKGGCGQIDATLRADDSLRPSASLSRADLTKLLDVWDRWHLNDMRAGTPRQQQHVREHRHEFSTLRFYEDACASLARAGLLVDDEVCCECHQPLIAAVDDVDSTYCPRCVAVRSGYKYGTAWLREDVPVDVVEFLRKLPDNTSTFPWRERSL